MFKNLISRALPALALAAAAFMAPASHAQSTQLYQNVSPVQPTDNPDKIVVVEFFAFSCPHCFHMEPMMLNWAKAQKPDVQFEQVPVAFNAAMQPMQQLYYTLKIMNRLDLAPKVFNAIHVENKPLFTKDAIESWIATQGIDPKQFDSIYNSFSVQTDVQRANAMMNAYNVEGTPSFGVDGRYLTSPVLAGNSYEGAEQETSVLVDMARKLRAGAAAAQK